MDFCRQPTVVIVVGENLKGVEELNIVDTDSRRIRIDEAFLRFASVLD